MKGNLIRQLLSGTLKGIVKALQEFQKKLLEHKVAIFVRRGGPNYQEGLRVMREVGKVAIYLSVLFNTPKMSQIILKSDDL